MNRFELDYYMILNVPRTASKEEITLAYGNLALRLCPFNDKKDDDAMLPIDNSNLFTQIVKLSKTRRWEHINMAFDILGNDMHRSIYDRYGEGGLCAGVLLPNGYFPPYHYDGDHMRVYNSVFVHFSPYINIMDAITNPPVLFASATYGIGVKDAPVERVVYLELEEVRNGCTKLMNVWREEIVGCNSITTEKRQKTLILNIQPGCAPGTRFTFREEGDQHPSRIPGDIIFITADKKHSTFERINMHDLICYHEISISEALIGFLCNVTTLDKRLVTINITDVVKPGHRHILAGEGLPKCTVHTTETLFKPKPLIYGDMIIEFVVKFPTYLNKEMKIEVEDFFKRLSEMEREMLEAE